MAHIKPRLPDFGALSLRLAMMVEQQIDALESEETGNIYSEARAKALLQLIKTLQAAGEAVGQQEKQEKAKDEHHADGVDILEFRQRLARKIEALAGSGAGAGAVAGPAGA